MPDDDTMLAQHTIDFRNEERRARQYTPYPELEASIWSEHDQQIALCSNDHKCQADADEHNPDCPIEAELRETFGF